VVGRHADRVTEQGGDQRRVEAERQRLLSDPAELGGRQPCARQRLGSRVRSSACVVGDARRVHDESPSLERGSPGDGARDAVSQIPHLVAGTRRHLDAALVTRQNIAGALRTQSTARRPSAVVGSYTRSFGHSSSRLKPNAMRAAFSGRRVRPLVHERVQRIAARLCAYNCPCGPCISVSPNDQARLEELCRYFLRPPLAQGRVRLRADGRVLVRTQDGVARWSAPCCRSFSLPCAGCLGPCRQRLRRKAGITCSPSIRIPRSATSCGTPGHCARASSVVMPSSSR
jgi:hypothetical protein